MLWVGCLLHIANVQLEECLGAEGEELCDIMMVLDWCSTEHPCVLGLMSEGGTAYHITA